MATGRGRAPRDNDLRTLVAVDTAVLTIVPGEDALSVLQVRRAEGRGWALPSTFVHADEQLSDAVLRSLLDVGVTGVAPGQLHSFAEPDRDPRGGVLTVAHVMGVPAEVLATRVSSTRLVAATAPGRLPHRQGAIVELALEASRSRYAERPDPDGLLVEPFSILDLRRVHAAVAGQDLQKDTFRRAMEPHLVGTGTASASSRGRPAELFRRR